MSELWFCAIVTGAFIAWCFNIWSEHNIAHYLGYEVNELFPY